MTAPKSPRRGAPAAPPRGRERPVATPPPDAAAGGKAAKPPRKRRSPFVL